MEPLIKSGDLIVSGQHPSLPNARIPLWLRGSNVLFEDEAVRPVPGQSLLFVPPDFTRVVGIGSFYFVDSGVVKPILVWGTKTGLYSGVLPATVTDVTRLAGPYTGGDSDLWSLIQFGGTFLATNGKDEVQYKVPVSADFVNISTVSDLPSTFRCKHLWVQSAYVLAFNTDNDVAEMRWCSEDDPTTWLPLPDNTARDEQVRDLLSDIVCVIGFANGFLLIGRDQGHFARFIGPPFFFGSEHLMENIGAVGAHSAISFDRIAYGFAADGIWEADGSTSNRISIPSIQKYIFEDTFDESRSAQVVCWSNASNTQVYWSYPTKNGSGTTVSFDRVKRVWALHNFWRTAAAQSGMFGFPILGSPNGGVFGQGIAEAAATGEAFPVEVQDLGQIVTGYGQPGYGGSGYGGVQVFV